MKKGRKSPMMKQKLKQCRNEIKMQNKRNNKKNA